MNNIQSLSAFCPASDLQKAQGPLQLPGLFIVPCRDTSSQKLGGDTAKMMTASSAAELIQRCWVSGGIRRESPADIAI